MPLRCQCDGRSGVLKGLPGHSAKSEPRLLIIALEAASVTVLAGFERMRSAGPSEGKSRPLKAKTRVQIPLEPPLRGGRERPFLFSAAAELAGRERSGLNPTLVPRRIALFQARGFRVGLERGSTGAITGSGTPDVGFRAAGRRSAGVRDADSGRPGRPRAGRGDLAS